MPKQLKIAHIIIICLFVNIILIIGGYFYFQTYGLSFVTDKLSGSLKEIVNQKVVEKNISEFRNLSLLESDITQSIDSVSDSVVSIVVTKNLQVLYDDPFGSTAGAGAVVKDEQAKIGGGSGIIFSSDGYIITSKHVVDDTTAEYSVLTKNGSTYKVDKIWLDPILDLAVLKIVDSKNQAPTDLKSATFNSLDSKVKIGQFVIAIGYSLGEFENSVTFGIISGKNRKLLNVPTDKSIYIGLYQTDTPINPGNSGGPLLDIKGNVIGLNTAISSMGNSIAFALPLNSEFTRATIDSIIKFGKIIRPYIGIQHIDLNPTLAKQLNLKKFEGALVDSITPGSPAFKAGLKKGDIIIDINDRKLDQDLPFLYQLYTYKPGDKVQFLVYRDEAYQKIDITLEKKE